MLHNNIITIKPECENLADHTHLLSSFRSHTEPPPLFSIFLRLRCPNPSVSGSGLLSGPSSLPIIGFELISGWLQISLSAIKATWEWEQAQGNGAPYKGVNRLNSLESCARGKRRRPEPERERSAPAVPQRREGRPNGRTKRGALFTPAHTHGLSRHSNSKGGNGGGCRRKKNAEACVAHLTSLYTTDHNV